MSCWPNSSSTFDQNDRPPTKTPIILIDPAPEAAPTLVLQLPWSQPEIFHAIWKFTHFIRPNALIKASDVIRENRRNLRIALSFQLWALSWWDVSPKQLIHLRIIISHSSDAYQFDRNLTPFPQIYFLLSVFICVNLCPNPSCVICVSCGYYWTCGSLSALSLQLSALSRWASA